jgi:hypothetical protein
LCWWAGFYDATLDVGLEEERFHSSKCAPLQMALETFSSEVDCSKGEKLYRAGRQRGDVGEITFQEVASWNGQCVATDDPPQRKMKAIQGIQKEFARESYEMHFLRQYCTKDAHNQRVLRG